MVLATKRASKSYKLCALYAQHMNPKIIAFECNFSPIVEKRQVLTSACPPVLTSAVSSGPCPAELKAATEKAYLKRGRGEKNKRKEIIEMKNRNKRIKIEEKN